MKPTTIFLLILSFAMTGCNENNNENNNDTNTTKNYIEIEEQYKSITVPMVKREDLE